VLRCLADAGEAGLTLTDLSKRLMVTCGNTTGVVDRLEQAGHLRRERCPEDRRVVRAQMSVSGRLLYEEMMPAYQELITSLMGGLSVEEKELIAQLCETLHRSVDEGRPAEADLLAGRLRAPRRGGVDTE